MDDSTDAGVATIARAMGATEVVAWIESEFGGRVVRLERLPRWRVGWFVDVERRGAVIELYVRGERGPAFPSPYTLDHERVVHDMLEDHDFPVPHVYGIIELASWRAMVMDRVRGEQGLMSAPDEATRRRLMFECVDHMARMHRISVDELERRGFDVPATTYDIEWSGAIARLEKNYLSSSHPPDPVIEFLRLWLRRNLPRDRTRPAFVTWDAAQFLHHDGELTALIDFELAHVGDPYMDLAPLRSRDTMEPFGDLSGAFRRYEQATGEAIDMDVVRYFEVSQLAATLMLQRPVLVEPDPNSDLVTHIVWYIESARYALDVLAELHALSLDVVTGVRGSPSAHGVTHAHLVSGLHAASRARGPVENDPVDVLRRWRARCDYRLARHLQRVDEIGVLVAQAELDDIATVVGRHFADLAAADAALVAVVRSEDTARDVELIQYFNRRMQRASMLLGPPEALLAQHVPLQQLPR